MREFSEQMHKMIRREKILLTITLTLIVLGAAAILVRFLVRAPHPLPTVTLEGDVLRQDSDPLKQTPLAGVTVIASRGSTAVSAQSSPSGHFSVTMSRGFPWDQTVMLTFSYPDYEPLTIAATKPGDQLYMARMQPRPVTLKTVRSPESGIQSKFIEIKDIRVRYSFKDQSTINVGSLARQFSARNKGNVPCAGGQPCSPDGRWRATWTSISLDAQDGNEFRNIRVSCIAGPCAFTKVEPENFSRLARKVTVSVLNWSDTADFLVEADVVRTVATNTIENSYPFVVGQTMSFALPPSSEGPSIEANVDGQYVVFPLGPDLLLSWANCTFEASRDGNKLYRCSLKPGYRFQG